MLFFLSSNLSNSTNFQFVQFAQFDDDYLSAGNPLKAYAKGSANQIRKIISCFCFYHQIYRIQRISNSFNLRNSMMIIYLPENQLKTYAKGSANHIRKIISCFCFYHLIIIIRSSKNSFIFGAEKDYE